MSRMAARLDDLARTRGQDVAIIGDDETLTFGELDARARRLAAGLVGLGIRPGDSVGIWLPNIPAYVAFVAACARIGAVVVSCNTRFRSMEMADVISRSRMKLLVLWPGFARVPFLDILHGVPAESLDTLETVVLIGGRAEAFSEVLPRQRVVDVSDLHRHGEAEIYQHGPEDGFVTFMTSGTTSRPKFALHSEAGAMQHAEDVATAFGYRDGRVLVMTANPLCGVLGFCQAVAALAAGVPQFLPTVFDGKAMAAGMRRLGVTHTNAIDEALDRLLEAVDEDPAFPSLHSAGSGSYNGDFEAFVRRADPRGLKAFGIYGMSEVLALYSRQKLEAPVEKRAQAGGFPVSPAARVRARDPQTGAVLPDGEVGEIEVSGPSRMLRYLGDPAATERALTADGFMRTGDAGCTNPDGSFTFMARMGDALRLGGFLVSPQEIASEIEGHPSIEQCQVVGVKVGSALKPVAFVITRGDASFDESDVVAHCRSRMAPFKVPVRILATEDFPRSVGPNGEKVQRTKLREMAEAALA